MPPAKHILCIYLPHWPIARRYRRHPELRTAPTAVIRAIGQQRLVVDASSAAQKQGVRVGMSAAEAKSLCFTLRCLDEDTLADYRALAALGRWLIRFSPIVSLGWDDLTSSPITAPDGSPGLVAVPPRTSVRGYQRSRSNVFCPSVLFLDLTGSQRLFGSFDQLIERIKFSLTQFGLPAQLALAPTPGAAWAFALAGSNTPIVLDLSSLPTIAAPLPIECLRLDETILENLHQLGLHAIGDVAALSREQLPSRFGPLLLKRLDQLIGALVEPLTKLLNDPPVTARMEFESPIESLEDIWRIFEKLLGLVITDLTRRGHGVRRLRMIFKPDRGWGLPTVTREISLSRPHRHRATLLSLIRCETERVDCEHGFVRFQLEVPSHEPVAEAQTQLFDQQSLEEELELDRLLQRLRVRLGEAAVIRPTLVESYLPERAWKSASDESTAIVTTTIPPRPLTLFPTPIEIRVISEPSDDRTGQPRQFTWQGEVHRLIHAVGPERIAGEWWRGHRHTRDYYDAEDETGQRFWMFRVLHVRPDETVGTRWFLHGRFN